MREDEVMSELRAIRAAYAKKFGYDLRRMVADLQRQEAEAQQASMAAPDRVKKATRRAPKPPAKSSKRRRAA